MTINVEARAMDIASIIAGIAMLVRVSMVLFYPRNTCTSRAYPLSINTLVLILNVGFTHDMIDSMCLLGYLVPRNRQCNNGILYDIKLYGRLQ